MMMMMMILLFLLFPLFPMPQVHIVVDVWLAQLAVAVVVELQDVLAQLLQLLVVVGWLDAVTMLLLQHLKAMKTQIMEISSLHLNPPAHLEYTLAIHSSGIQ